MNKTKICMILFLLCVTLCGCGGKDTDQGEKMKDAAALGTTLDAGVDANDSLTGISCVNLEAGGCVYSWGWHGILFHMIVPWDVDMDYYEGRMIYGIAEDSYMQPEL